MGAPNNSHRRTYTYQVEAPQTDALKAATSAMICGKPEPNPDLYKSVKPEDYQGNTPLPYVGHEEVAQWLAAPQMLRKYCSIRAISRGLNVSVNTIYRYSRNQYVLTRAFWLSAHIKHRGDLVGRRNWEQIMEGQTAAAIAGDSQAAKFVEGRAWPEDRREETPGVNVNISLLDAVRGTENRGDAPTFVADDEEILEAGLAKPESETISEQEES